MGTKKVSFIVAAHEPLAIGFLAALAREKGCEVRVHYAPSLFADYMFLDVPLFARALDDVKRLVREISDFAPDLVCASVMTPNFPYFARLARAIKASCDAKVLFGGAHPTLEPEVSLTESGADMVCEGDGFASLPKLLEQELEPEGVPNLWFKKDGEVRKSEAVAWLEDADSLPLPARELTAPYFVYRSYYPAISGFGCPFSCAFCINSYYARAYGSRRLRRRSVDHFLAELAQAKRSFGITFVDISDEDFCPDYRWLEEFAQRYPREVGVPYYVSANINWLDERTVELLKESGCARVELGFQTPDAATRKAIGREFEPSNERALEVFDLLHRKGLAFQLDRIIGFPSEPRSAHIEAVKLYSRARPARIAVYFLSLFPKYDITMQALERGLITSEDYERIRRGHAPVFARMSYRTDAETLEFYRAEYALMRLISPVRLKRADRWLTSRFRRRLLARMPASLWMFVDFLNAIKTRDYQAKYYRRKLLKDLWLRLKLGLRAKRR